MDDDLRLAAIEASKLFKKGKYEDAVDICTLGISDYPQYSSLYLILAKSYLALGNVSEAHKVFESASKFFVNDPLINTLRDILEVTPTINSEPPKKKIQQAIDSSKEFDENTTSSEVDEPIENENILVEEESEFRSIQEEELPEGEEVSELSYDFSEVTNDFEAVTNDFEAVTDDFEVVTEDSTKVVEEVLIQHVIDDEDDGTSINTFENSIDEIVVNDEVFEDELQSSDSQEITIEDEIEYEHDSEFDEVLSGFDEIVANLETDEIDDNESLTSITESKKATPLVFESPIEHSSRNNFIQKIRETTTPIDSLQFTIEKIQFLSVLPSLKEISQSTSKVHHVDNFLITLENPLQELDMVTTITNEPIVFEDTYNRKRKENDDVIVFENSIEGLDSLDFIFQQIGKKA